MEAADHLARLQELFRRSGYARSTPRKPGSKTHRGYELRFGALTLTEAREITHLLRELGFEPGRAFRKKTHYRIPVYGVQQILDLVWLLGIPAQRRFLGRYAK